VFVIIKGKHKLVSTKPSLANFNGYPYETATGQVISAINNAGKKSSRAIDGFVKAPLKFSSSKPHHQAVDFHERPQKAHTLMRDGLKKPTQKLQSNVQRLTLTNIDRELRAKLTSKHGQVNRFGGHGSTKNTKTHQAAQPLSGELVSHRPASTHHQPASPVAAPLPSMVTSASHQKLERLLDEALLRADAHKQALRYQAARHFWQKQWFSGPRRWLVVVSLFVVLVGGIVVAWQKIPQVSIKVAGMKAHLSPAVPSYKPEGYSLARPAKAASGAVSLAYNAPSGRGYTIQQAQSNLTSSSVAQNVIPKGAPVQTSQVAGNTVYIYGQDNDVAWVNNGVLYTIKDKANLSSDELIKIVRGLNP
jgi:hypothetical protein